MEQVKTIAGVTVTIEVSENCPLHIDKVASLESAVRYMKRRDVIYKSVRMGTQMYTLTIEKTDEANENWYQNKMRINKQGPGLPTNMWK